MAILNYRMLGSWLAHRHHATTCKTAERASVLGKQLGMNWTANLYTPMCFRRTVLLTYHWDRAFDTSHPFEGLLMNQMQTQKPKKPRVYVSKRALPSAHTGQRSPSCLLISQTDPTHVATTKLGLWSPRNLPQSREPCLTTYQYGDCGWLSQ